MNKITKLAQLKPFGIEENRVKKMKNEVFEKINSNVENLRRSKSIGWIAKSIIANPSVIFVTDKANGKERQLISLIEELGGKLTEETELVDISDDLTDLNKKGKPIVFDSHVVIH